MKKQTLILTLLFVLGLSNLLYSQDWDYQKYPKMDITLQHLNADIHIDEFGAIEGDLLYRATVNIDDPDSLVFDASRLNIISVHVNNADREFSVQNDHLVIYLDQVFAQGSVLNIRIQYEANPQFGILRDVNRTMWTSQLPKSTRHWLPVMDHPRVQFTSEFVFTHPSGNTMLATGRNMGAEVVSVDEERTTFESESSVPVSALGWALGEMTEVSSGTVSRMSRGGPQNPVRVQVYSESALSNEINLADVAAGTIQNVRSKLGSPYPYRDLSIVVLDHNFWETKGYAAGLIFVYRDQGDIEQQIKRGVLSQWFGVQIREEQWSDADAILAIHAILANELFDFEPILATTDEPYNTFSFQNYAKWEQHMQSSDVARFETSLQTALNDILSNSINILGWNELSEIIYKETGQPYFEGFEPADLETEEQEQIIYTADIDWNETDNTIQISFIAENQVVDELVTVAVEEITFQEMKQHEVTFTGESESSVLSVSSGVENIKLMIEGRDDIELNVQKPFMFWVNQLRSDTDPQYRMEAAKGLANYTENPDLQLALNDVLRMESNPQVYAEIIRSLSEITAGATGMDQRFLEYSSSQRHSEVRKAAVEALADFPGNEQVISRLQNIIAQSQGAGLKEAAIRSLAKVTDPARFNSIASTLVTQESVLEQVPFIIRLLGEKGEEESAVDLASTFITEQFPYDVRRDALEIILQYDRSSDNWEDRLPDLLNDIHPGIRYRAANALEYVNLSARRSIVELALPEEYDERVRRVLNEYTSN